MAAVTAIISTGLAVGGAIKSFNDASKQQTAIDEANAAAEKSAAAASKKLEKNVYEGLDLNIKAFQRERYSLAGVASNLITAGQEGERGAGVMAGQVLQGVQKAEQNITDRQISSMENIEKIVADEESRLQKARVNLDLGEAQGAQLAARDAAAAKNASLTQGVTQLGQAGMSLYENSELYRQKKSPVQTSRVGGNDISNAVIANSPTRFGTNAAGQTVSLADQFKIDSSNSLFGNSLAGIADVSSL